MELTFLGTGAAGGVPLYGCNCAACERARLEKPRVRRPCSALLKVGGTSILIDAGLMDLHERFQPGDVDAIVLTHFHPDHVQGLFHWRWGSSGPLTVYCPPDADGCADLFKNPGFLDFRPVQKFEPFNIGEVSVTPLPLVHSKLSYGYCMESETGAGRASLAWLTDTVGLPDKTLDWLAARSIDVACLDATHPPVDGRRPSNHNDIALALDLLAQIGAQRSFLTHLSHAADEWLIRQRPVWSASIAIAADGMSLHV